ncbi:hypothetical protein IWX89_003683 [Cryobacterium sp. MP_M3]|uniref:hypothetical protein n=1 Tax=unclassified Cryobacterium TaxID=2649013 RepID=UPI0018CBB962|nr:MULTISPECIES: hypothetical protein [unclassified Cryobacterium]MBG6060209.1 hypothetical protein [Cryobacterium sp. MP_M3]
MSELVSCETKDELLDDMSYYDTMTGFNCNHDLGPATLVHIYSTVGSPDQVLQDWAPLLNPDRQVLIGRSWFVIGGISDLTKIKSRFGDAVGPTVYVPAASQLNLKASEITGCVRAATSGIMQYATENQKYEEDAANLDTVYPGIDALVRSVVTENVAKEIQGLWESDSLKLEANLTRFGPKVKSYCSKAYDEANPNATRG